MSEVIDLQRYRDQRAQKDAEELDNFLDWLTLECQTSPRLLAALEKCFPEEKT